MNEKVLLIALGATVLLLIAFIAYRRMPRKLKNTYFVTKWRELQRNCADRKNWPAALKGADTLLDAALKKRRYKGKRMGARLMAAQRQISDNDGIWAAHNLAKKLIAVVEGEKAVKLTKTQVKESLESYKATLTDLGAFRREKKD